MLTNSMCAKCQNSEGVTNSNLNYKWPVFIFSLIISVLAHYTVICQSFFFKT